jgi:hypothetical protein
MSSATAAAHFARTPRPAMLADYEGTEHAARRVLDKRIENHVPST